MPRLPPRYTAVKRLGAGGQGSVWLASDARVPGRSVAVKVLPEGSDGRSLRREFALISRLRHPGLPAVLELGTTPEGRPYLVSEYLAGRPLCAWHRDADRAAGIGAIGQLLVIVDFLHRRGVIHRDLKPDNVLIDEGLVRLVDFGLATRVGAREEVAGTAGYIAPEVLAGEAPCAASDLYAAGVMLFELLWQRKPFVGSASEITTAQLTREASVPSEDVRPGLHALVSQLLRRDPAQRPPSAAETLALLEEQLPGPSAAVALARQGLPGPVLVGRDAELERIERALQATARRPLPDGFLLVGQPGSGRTRLADEVACRGQLTGHRVRRGLGDDRDQRAAGAPPLSDPAAEGARAAHRVIASITHMAEQPLLLVIDDLVDPFEAQVLLALTRIELPLTICATAPLGGTVEELLRPVFTRLELGPLDAAEIETLVRSMLPAGWTADLATAIQGRAAGSPLLATEATRALVESTRGLDASAAHALSAKPRAADDVLNAICQLRRARLTADEALAAARVALFHHGLPLDLLANFDELTPRRVRSLEQQGVLLQTADRLIVVGRWLAEDLLADLPPARRHELAREVLRALEARDRPAPERARVVVNGGLAREHAGLLLDGAQVARDALDLVEAIELLEAATPGLEGEKRQTAATELANLRLATGKTRAAVEGLRAAVTTTDEPMRSRLLCALADAQLKSGAVNEGLETLEHAEPTNPGRVATRAKLLCFAGRHAEAEAAAIAALDAPDPAIRGDAQNTLALCAFYLGRYDEALQALQRAAELARSADDELLGLRVENSLALVQQRRSAFEPARACYERCIATAQRLGHLPYEATFLMNLGSLVQQRGDHAAALQHYERSLEVARSFGGARETAQVQHNLGRLLGLLGQRDNALTQLRRSLELSHTMGWRALEAHNLIVRAEVGIDHDQADGVEADLDRAEAILSQLSDDFGRADVALARARARLLADRPAEALEFVTRARTLAGEAAVIGVQADLIAGRAELARGDAEAALRSLRAALHLAEDSQEGEYLVEIHHFLAQALEGRGDQLAATTHRDAARRRLETLLQQLPRRLHPAYLGVSVRGDVLAHDRGEGALGAGRHAGGTGLDADLLAALLEINKELNAEPNLQRLLERIIDHAVELTGAERGFLLLSRKDQPSSKPLRIEVARNIDHETIRRKSFKISRSVAEEVLSSGRPVIAVNAMEDERFAEFLSVHALRLRSILCVPMTIRRQPRGAIYLDNRFQTQTFTEEHRELLSALADQAALAVGNRELIEANQQRQAELERSQQELSALNGRLQQAMEQQSLRLDELTRLTRSQQGELQGRYQFENLVGQSAAMRELFRLMNRVADSDAPVLIHGESGTGKELVAKALHYNGARRDGPVISVNCGALSPTLLESELFGYVKGAFTGAERLHRGLFERSHGGSLFLDEVGEMPSELQVKLLRVLQEKRFSRVGGEEELASDFRLLAASNKDLKHLVEQGNFREDLYYRINVIQLRLPPLRERREDIPLLIEHLLRRHGGGEVELARAALDRLLAYDWPGNVRELENELLRLLALGDEVIQPDDLSPHVHGSSAPARPAPAGPLKETLHQVEHEIVIATLRDCGGRVADAAQRLGLSRVGLYKLMKRHGIAPADVTRS